MKYIKKPICALIALILTITILFSSNSYAAPATVNGNGKVTYISDIPDDIDIGEKAFIKNTDYIGNISGDTEQNTDIIKNVYDILNDGSENSTDRMKKLSDESKNSTDCMKKLSDESTGSHDRMKKLSSEPKKATGYSATKADTADDTTKEPDGTNIIPIELNNQIRDSLPSALSKNIYTFTLGERGAIVYAFQHTVYSGDKCRWQITLYEEYSPDGTEKTTGYREINSVEYDTVGKAVNSPITGLLPGKYRLEVECYSGYIDEKYDIAIIFDPSAKYETEPNDSMSRYTYLPLNKTLTGSASAHRDNASDVDWFMFEITDTGYSALYFSHEADTNSQTSGQVATAWRISLTDLNGNEYFYTTSNMEAASLNSGVLGLTPGYYVIAVYSHIRSGVSYDISVSFSADQSIEREFNETRDTATVIKPNDQMVGSLTQRDVVPDIDHYKFTMEEDGYFVLDFIHESLAQSRNGWNITVTAEDGTLVYTAVSNWTDGILQSPCIGVKKGDFYIKIDSDNLYRNSIVYRMTLLTFTDENWESEPNNTPETADIITPGTPIGGSMVELGTDFDRDWFVFELEEDDSVIDVCFSHKPTDEPEKESWIISLLDEDMNVLRKMNINRDEKSKTFVLNKASKGKYYVLVETGLYFTGDSYDLLLTVK